MNITSIFTLICGISLFLYGMSLMGDSLKKIAGNKMETILYKLTSTPTKGILLGLVVTAIIQSSSATTVMVVGFVNSGMMKVSQAIGIIMGANIGTSVTGWILCLSYIDGSSGIAALLSTATMSAMIAFIGITIKMLAKKRVYRSIGDIMLGFAILMTGMQMMSGAVVPLRTNESFIQMLTMLKHPIAGIFAGIVLTVILQSASASVGVLQALSVTGQLQFAAALPIIMGIGIGAAFPVILSSIGTNKDGKRTALVYLTNDTTGMIVWAAVFYSLNAILHFSFLDTVMTPMTVALMNTLFRVATLCILAPCIKLVEKLVYTIIKDSPEDDEEQADFSLLEERLLNYPALAIPQAQQVMNDVAIRSRKAVKRALGLFNNYSEEIFRKIEMTEALVDQYEDRLGTYLIKLSERKMTLSQSQKVTKYLYTISDFESLSDYALNIAFVATELYEMKASFSEYAERDLEVLKAATVEMVDLIITAFLEENLHKAKRVEPLREYINCMLGELKDRHVDRLSSGTCTIAHGTMFNDILANVERLCTHCSNIAVAMNKLAASTGYYNDYHRMAQETRDASYTKYFYEYEEKYSLSKNGTV